jgi:uncharacterized membrane protein
MSFTEIMEHTARGFEGLAALVLVAGLVWALIYSAVIWRRHKDGRLAYRTLREMFGGILLLGLEILVAADLLLSVAVEPTLTNVAVLGLIVVVRTVLSFSLEIEIRGVAPWRVAELKRAPVVGPELPRG